MHEQFEISKTVLNQLNMIKFKLVRIGKKNQSLLLNISYTQRGDNKQLHTTKFNLAWLG